MINEEKLLRIEAQFDRLNDERKARHDRYSARIARSKGLRGEAVWNALPEVQTMSLAELLMLGEDELRDAGVDGATLRRAALERRMADEELRGNRAGDADYTALGQLVTNLRKYAGVMS